MGIWQWIGEAAEGSAGAVGAVFAWAGGVFTGIGDPVRRREAAFSIALIALSAKMAKADGVVTRDEVAVFRRMFSVAPGEEGHVERLFDLARQDTAGYDSYARRIAVLYADNPAGLEDVLDGLFVVATADGAVHEAEYAYLESVAAIFGMAGAAFERIAARHVVPDEGDPYVVLGVARDLKFREIRSQYLRLVSENHPDRVIARGLPPDFVAIANDRLAAINRAWERIERERAGEAKR
jgi:DnaJ like chaperone protein